MNIAELTQDFHNKNTTRSANVAFLSIFNRDSNHLANEEDKKLWQTFYEEWSRLESARRAQLHNYEGFIKELSELCAKYHVNLSSGCGCCGAGGTFSPKKYEDKFEFMFDIKGAS